MKKEIDIMKSIGIILVVLGHTTFPFRNIIYLFHVSLFFFIAGYLLNTKYTTKDILIKRVKSLYIPFITYCLIFIFFNNILFKLGIVRNSLEFIDKIKYFIFALLFKNQNELLGAIWFIPTLFFATLFYFLVIKVINRSKYIIFLMSMIYLAVFYLNSLMFAGKKFIVIILMAAFVIFCGNLYRKNEHFMNKVIIIPMIIIFSLCIYYNVKIEYASLSFSNPLIFIASNLSGIILVKLISEWLSKYSLVNNISKIISKNTYHIMALHFLVFRILNKVYAKNSDEIFSFPMIGSKKLWFVYFMLGIIIPIILMHIINFIKGVIYDNSINSNISQ